MKLGNAFSDSVTLGKSTRTKLSKPDAPTWWLGAGRALLFATLLCIALFILIIRLLHLTLIRGHELRALADGNRTRELVRHAPRGRILDRTGKVLADNIANYRLLTPCKGSVEKECAEIISKEVQMRLLKRGLLKGSHIEVEYVRNYPLADTVAHSVGYTGELSPKELSQDYYTQRNYHRGDRVGRSGAEAVYEEKLRGRDGRELVEVDALGTIVRVLGQDREIAGEDVWLSFDAGIMDIVSRAFPVGFKGGVVVSKPTTGEILAILSFPSYDINAFSRGLSEAEYQSLIEDPDRPLFNRAIGGTYPPGSTFKIVTSLAGLEEGGITGDTTVDDAGTITIGPYSFANWFFTEYGKTEGPIQIVRAIARSNDIFFYKVGEWTGITKLATWARKVGLGTPLGIELGGEASGLMPDPDWKKRQFTSPKDLDERNQVWYLGDTYHAAIGQGYVLATPLQVNTWTNVIANGGKLCRPTIEKVQSALRSSGQAKGSPRRRVAEGGDKVQNCKDLEIKKETIQLITKGMIGACEPGGTGWPLFNFSIKRHASSITPESISSVDMTRDTLTLDTISIPVVCKTGTAEFGVDKDKTHAWFTAFAPLRPPQADFAGQAPLLDSQSVITGDPEISVTVLIEGGGEGSTTAGPVVKKILEEWFGR